MFCPVCGRSISDENNRFCTDCGHEHGAPIRRSIQSQTPPQVERKKDNGAKFLVLIVVTILIGVAALGGLMGSFDKEPPKIYTWDLEGKTLELSGDLHPDENRFSVYFNDDGELVFELNEDLAEGYDFFKWTFLDLNLPSSSSRSSYTQNVGEAFIKEESWLCFSSPRIGEYSITVECYRISGEKSLKVHTYSGQLSYLGTIVKEYVWNYSGTTYTASISFEFSDYINYKNSQKGKRSVYDYNQITSFVTIDDPALKGLADSLTLAYKGDPNIKNGDYANFILGFVQICYVYPPYVGTSVYSGAGDMSGDKYLYGWNEYYAYPLETIYHGMGDCEDTSILAAALFNICGFDAAVALFPGHAIAGVAIEGYDISIPSPRYEILTQTVNGITYYGCETTLETARKAGIIDIIDGDPFSNYLDTRSSFRQLYGFYPVTSS